MAEVLTAKINLVMTWAHTGSVGLVPAVNAGGSMTHSVSFINGAGAAALEINEIYHGERVLAPSANEELDLAASLANAFRTAITFNRVKTLVIILADVAAQASSLKVGGAAAAGFIAPFADATDKLNILKGGALVLLAGNITAYAAVATTADKLKIENMDATNSATYKILLLGTKP